MLTTDTAIAIPDLPTELWEITRLTPYERNAKIHEPQKIARLASSIRQFGWGKQKAIEVDSSGIIINGHGRRLAAMKLGMTHVPVVVRSDLSSEQVQAYRLADNKVAEGEYDTRILSDELRSLYLDADFDMSDFFTEKELSFALDDLGEIDVDALTTDLSAEVDEHSDRTNDAIEGEKAVKMSIGDALGIKTCTIEQGRALNKLMVVAKAFFPKEDPGESLVALITDKGLLL